MLIVIEYGVGILFLAALVTQVFVPMWNERPLFPLFRKRRKLEKTLVQLHERQDEAALSERIRNERRGKRS